MAANDEGPVPVRFPQLDRQGIVYGLGMVNVGTIVAAVGLIIVIVMKVGFLGLILSSPAWGFLIYLGLRNKRGKALTVLFLEAVVFEMRKSFGFTKWRRRTEGKAGKQGTLALPGVRQSWTILETEDEIGIVHSPNRETASFTLALSGTKFRESSPEIQAERVADWSKVLGSMTMKPGTSRISQVERSGPGSADAAWAFYRNEMNADVLDSIRRDYELSLHQVEGFVSSHSTSLAVTLDTSALAKDIAAQGGGQKGLMAVVSMEANGLVDALKKAGFANVQYVNAEAWALVGRNALNPDASTVRLDPKSAQVSAAESVQGVGIVALDEERDHAVTDAGFHRTYWVENWPRFAVYPGFVYSVVFATLPNGKPIRHTFNIVSKPVPINEAMKRIESEKRNWITNNELRGKTGKPTSAADNADWDNLVAQEIALVSGHGEFEYAGYITVTGRTLEELDAACSSMKNAMAKAGMEPALLYRQQAEALMLTAYPTGEGLK